MISLLYTGFYNIQLMYPRRKTGPEFIGIYFFLSWVMMESHFIFHYV